MPVSPHDPSVQRYRFVTELDLTPHLPTMHRVLERYLATYADPRTGLLYHSPLGDADAFPTPEEVAAEIPNSQGWYTAIEDCSFMGPLLLWGLSRSTCGLSDERRRELGSLLFAGLMRLWEVPGSGFIARGICPGRRDFYPNSSPDQVPNSLRGVWAWGRSGLASDAQQRLAGDVFNSVLGRLEKFNWELRRADDQPGLGGSTNLFGLSPRNMPQVLALFAMAADLTGQGRYIDLLRRFRDEGYFARLKLIEHDDSPTWLPWQLELCMQAARVLDELDPDPIARGAYRMGIRRYGALASTYIAGYGLWSSASRELGTGLQLAQPPAVQRRHAFRPGYRRSVELGIDLKARWGQVMQGRVIAMTAAEQPDAPPADGRACLTDHLWALSVVGQSGMPWSSDGARVQSDTRENWVQVAQDILAKSAPEVPWAWGAIAMVNFFSAWLRRSDDPR
jgi:hypothetical protein